MVGQYKIEGGALLDQAVGKEKGRDPYFTHFYRIGMDGSTVALLTDTTGAGDTFAGGFMGYLARSDRDDIDVLRRAIVMGGVLASFNVESFSLDRLRTLTRDEIRVRFGEFRRLAHFEELETDPFGAR